MNSDQHSRAISAHATRSIRRGRALVECIVAIFLLGVTALSMGATARSTLATADDASLVTHAQATVTTRIEDALSRPCGVAGNGSVSGPRIDVLWQQNGAARSTGMHLEAELRRSPIAGNAPAMTFAVDAGGVCP